MRWLLDHVEGARSAVDEGKARFGTIDSWLVYRLTGGETHVTDATNASRTLLMDLQTCDWDDGLLGIMEVPKNALPEIRSCSEVYGEERFRFSARWYSCRGDCRRSTGCSFWPGLFREWRGEMYLWYRLLSAYEYG